MNKKILPILGIILVTILWGISFLSIKIAVEVLPPMTLGLVRFIIASILFLIAIFIKKEDIKLNKKDIPLMIIAGFLGVTIYFYFENNGVKLLKASTASLIIATIPIFTLILDTIIYKTKITIVKIISVIASFYGVYLLVKGSPISESINTRVGYIMMFGAVLSWVLYTLVTKPLFGKYSQLVIVFYQSLIGTILFIPFALFESTDLTLIDKPIIINVLYLAVFCSAIAYFIYLYSMENLGVSTSSLYLNLIPLVTIITSIIVLKEDINFIQLIGGIFIIISVNIVNIEDKLKYKREMKLIK